MQRIIQKYQEGGTVQPATVTGLPAGGNAASAIANYMMGPMSANATTLSYTGGGEGVPDYHALALEQKKLREAVALAEVQAQVVPSSSGQDKMEERNLPGGNLYKPKLTQDQINSTKGSGVLNQSYTAPLLTGGGSDGYGNFGALGDVLGKAGDALGITDYAGKAKKAADERSKNYNGTEYVGTPTGTARFNMGGPLGYNMGSMKKPVGYNMGTVNGPIGYNVGGVSQVARTMLPEEQIQQRQMQQAQFSQGQGPLAEIGNALGMKVAGKGVDKALGKMAGSVAMKAAMGSIPVVGPFLAALFG
tara:strand:- start:886 stop:1797 length:912 start_codon:yes stop_codon:yes gene_type:complete